MAHFFVGLCRRTYGLWWFDDNPGRFLPSYAFRKEKEKKEARSHFQEATAQILSWARFLSSKTRKQLLFLIYDHERSAIKFSYVISLYKTLLQSVIKKQQPVEIVIAHSTKPSKLQCKMAELQSCILLLHPKDAKTAAYTEMRMWNCKWHSVYQSIFLLCQRSRLHGK